VTIETNPHETIPLRPHSFEITFIVRHVKVKLFWFTAWTTFLLSTFQFLAGDLKFCKVKIHLKFCKVTLFRAQVESRWVVNALEL